MRHFPLAAGRGATALALLFATSTLTLAIAPAKAQQVPMAQTEEERAAAAAAAQNDAVAETESAAVEESAGAAVQLDQVTVTASGFEQNVADAPASISVIPREQLETGSFSDLTDALRHVQGVSVTGAANEKDIYIRGLPGNYTLILVDGVRQNTRDARVNGSSGYEQDFIPPLEAIERIEVLRGPASTLYGSEAVGGVINIITRKVPERLTGSVTLEGTAQEHGRFGDSAQARFYAGTPLYSDILGLQVYGRAQTRSEDDYIAGTGSDETGDITARLSWKPNDVHSFLFEGGVTSVETRTSDNYTIERGSDDLRRTYEREHYKAAYEGQYAWGTVTADVQREIGSRKTETRTVLDDDWVANLREPEIENTVADLKAVLPFEFYGAQTLSLGGQYLGAELTDQNPGRRTGLDETFEIEEFSLFAEDEWQITDTFALTGGLRMNYHEVYEENFSPRLYGVWRPADSWTVKGGVSTGYKAPEIRQISEGYTYTTGGGNCFYGPEDALPPGRGPCGVILANTDLVPETSVNYEVGTIYDSYDGVRAGATFFWTDFKDKIQNDRVYNADGSFARWAEDPNYTLFTYMNVDEARLRGIELTAGFDPTDAITINASYTYIDSEQKTGAYAGLPLARTPEHQANVRADWITPVEGLSVFAAGFYHGEETNAGLRIGSVGEPVTDDDGNVIGRRYDGYFTADLGASYTFSENLRMNATVYNLFDKQVLPDEYNTLLEGRRFWASITASF